MESRSVNLAEEKEFDTGPTTSPQGSVRKEQTELADTPINNEDAAPQTAEEIEIAESEYPAGLALGLIVVALVLSIFLVALDMTIVATAIPKITDEFHGADLIGWYGAAFFMTVGGFQSTWGKAYKYFPLKITFLIGIFVFEIGSLLCGVAPNSTALIVGRAIAGVGAAGISSGSYTLIAFSARPRHRPAFTGLLGASYGIASVVGPLLGGVFAEKATWRWCFYINLPIGGIAAAIILFFFKAPSAAVPQKASLMEKLLQMDLPGAFVIMAAIVCYVLALQWGGQSKAWSSGSVIACLVMFGVLVAFFCVVEYLQGERAMIVGRLLKKRINWVGMGFIFFLAGGFFLLVYYIPIYFQVVSGVSASQSGVRNLPLILGVTIATILSGGLITVFGYYVPFTIGGAVLSTIGSGLIYTFSVTSASSEWIGYQALAGIGIGLALQVPVITAQAAAKPSDLSSVTAMILFAQTIGGALFVSAGQVAFTNVLLAKLPIYAPSVNPQSVVATGFTEYRNTFSPDLIPGIINACMEGLQVSYAIAIASSGIAFLFSLASPWENLKGKMAPGGAA